MNSQAFAVSLFSGAGGFSCGFARAGLKPIFGVEINPDACASYELNIDSPCHELDLSEVSPSKIKSMSGNTSPFVIIGGPPCQGFSTAGPRNAADPRNKLIFNYLAIVRELSPTWFVFENVEGLLTSGGGEDLHRLVNEFINFGYTVRLQKVNLAAYGVPQTRKRVIIMGNRLGIDFEFPEEQYSYDSGKAKKHSNLVMAPTLGEALSGLGKPSNSKNTLARYSSELPVNDFDRSMRRLNSLDVSFHYQTEEPKSYFELLAPGQTMKDLPLEHWHESFKRRANRRVADGTPTEKRGGAPSGIKRLSPQLQSLTITGAATREFVHPVEHRTLTIRECARIQTFPDSYEWIGNTGSIVQQIGNAVPPLAAESIASHLLRIDGRLGSGQPVKQAGPGLLGFKLTEASGMSPALKKTNLLLSELLNNAHSNSERYAA